MAHLQSNKLAYSTEWHQFWHLPLMVEVAQNHYQTASIIRAQGVFHRNLDVIKRNECSSRCKSIRSFDVLRLDTFSTFDQQDYYSLVRFAPQDEVVRERPIRNPFLPDPPTLSLLTPKTTMDNSP